MKHMKNDEAVSPVIGVILMVVITVIIAAVLAVFAFGVGSPAKVPQTKLKIETVYGAPTILEITNTGGDPLVLKELSIAVNELTGENLTEAYDMTTWVNGSIQYLAPGKSINGTIGTNGTNGTTPKAGDIINVQIMHNPTGQSIADTRVTVHKE